MKDCTYDILSTGQTGLSFLELLAYADEMFANTLTTEEIADIADIVYSKAAKQDSIVQKLGEIKHDYIVAGILSFIVSIHWAFIFNKILVFQTNEWKKTAKKELVKSYVTYGLSGLVLNNLLLYIFVDLCYVSKYYAPIIVLFFLIPFNYFVNKYWVYKVK